MREMQHDDRQEWTRGDARAPASRPGPERRLHYRIAKGTVAAASRSTIAALAGTRSDWLLHGRERAEVATPVVSTTEGSQTALARSSEFRDEDPEALLTDDGAALDQAADADDDDDEEFLTIGELAQELRFVERAPRTPHAKVIARGA